MANLTALSKQNERFRVAKMTRGAEEFDPVARLLANKPRFQGLTGWRTRIVPRAILIAGVLAEFCKIMGYCVAVYLGKLLIWEKVLSIGVTDPLAGWAEATAIIAAVTIFSAWLVSAVDRGRNPFK
jgi:hypothetical protein